MTLEEARTQVIFLRGYLASVDGGLPVEASGQDFGVEGAPVQGKYPDQDPEDPQEYLFFSLGDQERFRAAWQAVVEAARSTGRYQGPDAQHAASSPLTGTAGEGVQLIDLAFAALDWSPSRSVWPWVLGGLAIAGLLAASALAAAQQVKQPRRRRAPA